MVEVQWDNYLEETWERTVLYSTNPHVSILYVRIYK